MLFVIVSPTILSPFLMMYLEQWERYTSSFNSTLTTFSREYEFPRQNFLKCYSPYELIIIVESNDETSIDDITTAQKLINLEVLKESCSAVFHLSLSVFTGSFLVSQLGTASLLNLLASVLNTSRGSLGTSPLW